MPVATGRWSVSFAHVLAIDAPDDSPRRVPELIDAGLDRETVEDPAIVDSRVAATTPACHPGARPLAGGFIERAGRRLLPPGRSKWCAICALWVPRGVTGPH